MMPNCKNCIHYNACVMFIDVDLVKFECNSYEDKGLYKKLPCAIGDTVYLIRRMTEKECISRDIVTSVYYDRNKQRKYTHYEDRPYKIVKTDMKHSYYGLFGRMVFLDYIEAEQRQRILNKSVNII